MFVLVSPSSPLGHTTLSRLLLNTASLRDRRPKRRERGKRPFHSPSKASHTGYLHGQRLLRSRWLNARPSDPLRKNRLPADYSLQHWFNRPLQKRERTAKEYGCFRFVWKTKTFKWKINYILESLPRIEVFGGGKWQNGSSTNITQNREFVWIG